MTLISSDTFSPRTLRVCTASLQLSRSAWCANLPLLSTIRQPCVHPDSFRRGGQQVGANTGAISQASIPFGGIKESGFGREGKPPYAFLRVDSDTQDLTIGRFQGPSTASKTGRSSSWSRSEDCKLYTSTYMQPESLSPTSKSLRFEDVVAGDVGLDTEGVEDAVVAVEQLERRGESADLASVHDQDAIGADGSKRTASVKL